MACLSHCLLDRPGSPLITLEPIGVIRTPFLRKYDAPRQPGVGAESDVSVVELFPHKNFEQALEDLAGCERIWLVSWFDRAIGWKPKALPPRGRTKRGVFATRSPHRPNPIGLTCAELVDVQGLLLTVRGTDLLDGTPVLDIKPYIAYADSFPGSTVRWMDELEGQSYTIDDSQLSNVPAEVASYVRRVLAVDPFPHPYRRIAEEGNGVYVVAIGTYRVRYSVSANTIRIIETHVVL